MKIKTADGYQHGKAYRVSLQGAYQYADTAYESTEIVPKVKLVWTGKHGELSKLYTMPVVDGEPTLRPNLALSRALVAHGVTWDDVKSGLVIEPVDRKDRKAYTDWSKLPPLSAHKTKGFTAVGVDIEVGGRTLIGSPVVIQVEVDNDGIARPEVITAVPDDEADEADDAPAAPADTGEGDE